MMGDPHPSAGNAARARDRERGSVYGVVSSLIRQLRPAGFDELGIAAALENCVVEWRARLPEASSNCRSTADLTIQRIRALALFRLVQEA